MRDIYQGIKHICITVLDMDRKWCVGRYASVYLRHENNTSKIWWS